MTKHPGQQQGQPAQVQPQQQAQHQGQQPPQQQPQHQGQQAQATLPQQHLQVLGSIDPRHLQAAAYMGEQAMKAGFDMTTLFKLVTLAEKWAPQLIALSGDLQGVFGGGAAARPPEAGAQQAQ